MDLQRHHRRVRASLVVTLVAAGAALTSCSDDPADQLSGPAAVGADLAQSYNCCLLYTSRCV